MTRLLGAYAVLLLIGAAWGLSAPLIKYALTAGHRPVTILFCQALVASVVLGTALALTGRLRGMRWTLPHLRLYAVVGLFGMALPSWASYSATQYLPAGVISIVISLVPVFALTLALIIGTEGFVLRRLLGVLAGAGAMALLIAPQSSLPDPSVWLWVLVAALSPLCYAIEGAAVYGTRLRDVGPLQMLWAGYLISVAASVPLVLMDRAPLVPATLLDPSVLAFALAGLLGIGAYAGYLALLQRTGAVFGSQVSYLVTGTGVVWAMLLLGERYSGWVWGALALLFLGLFLVQPRKPSVTIVEDAHARA